MRRVRGPVAAVALAVLTAASPAAARPHLFLDDRWIASRSGVTRIAEPPRKLGPILDGAVDRNNQPYLTVLPGARGYRLWYGAKLPPDERLKLGYATSRDGIRFERPTRLLDAPTGYQFGVSIVRDRGGYLMAYFARARHTGADEDKGLNFARSRDGLRWTAEHRQPRFTPREVGFRRAPGDILSMIRFRGRYLLYVKMNGTGYTGITPHMPFPGYRRLVGVMESRDGRRWTLPKPIFTPDALDAGITEFYGLGGIARRGDLLVGFLRVLRDDLPAEPGGPVAGIGYTVLAWSRDGVRWQRDRAPFLDRAGAPAWDRAMAWADAQLPVGRRTLVYYGGYRSGHKVNPLTERLLGVAEMVRDRYAGGTGGTLTTVPLPLRGLTLNQRGTISFRAGRVSCVASGDGIAVEPRCSGRLPARGRLRFDLRAGVLFAVQRRI